MITRHHPSSPARHLGSFAALLSACLAGSGNVQAQQVTNAPAASPAPVKLAAKPALESDPLDLNNWIEFGLGSNFIRGNEGQYQYMKGTRARTYGGVEAFHFEQAVQQKGLLSVDGRGIFDNHDYSLKLELTHPDIGFIRAGVREFEQYYNLTGGYLPSNGLIFTPSDTRLTLDRRDIYFEAGLTMPDRPQVTFRYNRQTRDGQKDSTSWGNTTLTPGGVQKRISPAYRILDETRDLFSLDAKHAIGRTELGLGVRYETQDNNDSRNTLQQPQQGTSSRLLTQTERIDGDMFNVHASTDTRLNDKLRFTTGYSFTTMHTLISGSRLDTPLDPTGVLGTSDTRFANLSGGSDLKQYVMNVNLMYRPHKDVFIIPSLRVEKQDVNGDSSDTPIGGVPASIRQPFPAIGLSDQSALNVAQALDIRYTGLTNWVLYSRAELSEDQATGTDKFWSSRTNAASPLLYNSKTDWNRMGQKYTVGANWYPLTKMSVGAQYYRRISDNNYKALVDNTPTNYPSFLRAQNFNVDDANFRITWRPIPSLTLVSRYDYQLSTVDSRPEGLVEMKISDNERHMFGQTISWTPLNRLYIQAAMNYVNDRTDFPAGQVKGSAVGVVLPSKNNYWTTSGTVGFAVDFKTDLNASYSYYRADNFLDNSKIGLPYGAGAEEHNVSATLTRQLSKRVRWNLTYAFSSYRDVTSGGFNNFDSHGVHSTIQYRF